MRQKQYPNQKSSVNIWASEVELYDLKNAQFNITCHLLKTF